MAGTIDTRTGNPMSQDRVRLAVGLGGLAAILAIQAIGATILSGPHLPLRSQAGHAIAVADMRPFHDIRATVPPLPAAQQ